MTLTTSSDIPIKYALNMHLMESFIEKDSVVFEILKYLINQDSFKNDIKNIKFSTKTLKYIFGEEKLNEEKFKAFTINSIKELIADNLITVKGKTFYVTEPLVKKFYNITH